MPLDVIAPLLIVPKELLPKLLELPDAVILADRLNDVPKTAEVKVVPPILFELLVLIIDAEVVRRSVVVLPVTSIPVEVVASLVAALCFISTVEPKTSVNSFSKETVFGSLVDCVLL